MRESSTNQTKSSLRATQVRLRIAPGQPGAAPGRAGDQAAAKVGDLRDRQKPHYCSQVPVHILGPESGPRIGTALYISHQSTDRNPVPKKGPETGQAGPR